MLFPCATLYSPPQSVFPVNIGEIDIIIIYLDIEVIISTHIYKQIFRSIISTLGCWVRRSGSTFGERQSHLRVVSNHWSTLRT